MADGSWLTDGGEAKIATALATTSPFNITKWKVGSTENVTLDTALTDIVGTELDSGTVADIEFDVVSADHIHIRVILSESRGPYDVGNVGLFSDDDTLIALATFENAKEKTPNATGIVGNRLVLIIPIKFVDVQNAINFTLLSGTFASWPYVQTIAELPDANLSPWEGYIVREDPSQNRPITAIRNEDPPTSGNFIWTLDYHNKLAGDSDSVDECIEIDISTSEHRHISGGVTRYSLNSDILGMQNDTKIELSDGTVINPSLGFGSDPDTGLTLLADGTLSWVTGGQEAVTIDPNQDMLTQGSIYLEKDTTADLSVTIGSGRTVDGNAYIDLVGDSSYPDFGCRLIRIGGENNPSSLIHRGTGALHIRTDEAADLRLETNGLLRVRIDAAGDTHVSNTLNCLGPVQINGILDCLNYVKLHNTAGMTLNVGLGTEIDINPNGMQFESAGSAVSPLIRTRDDLDSGLYFTSTTGELAISDESTVVAEFDNNDGIRAPEGLTIGGGDKLHKVDNASRIYSGRIDAGATGGDLPSGWSVSKLNVGEYRLTHNLGVTGYALTANSEVKNTNVRTDVSWTNKNAFTIDIFVGDAGNGVNRDDVAVDFLLVRN